jgi:hypothetical protein
MLNEKTRQLHRHADHCSMATLFVCQDEVYKRTSQTAHSTHNSLSGCPDSEAGMRKKLGYSATHSVSYRRRLVGFSCARYAVINIGIGHRISFAFLTCGALTCGALGLHKQHEEKPRSGSRSNRCADRDKRMHRTPVRRTSQR